MVDTKNKAAEAERNGWVAIIDPQPGVHPRMASKKPKWCPGAYRELDDFPTQVWVDGSYVPSVYMPEVFDFAPWAMFPHPARDCLVDEAHTSMQMGKYRSYPVGRQADVYVEAGMPTHWGLWENGLHVRNLAAAGRVELFDDIWVEVQQWGPQCQMSMAYCCWRRGLRPADLPGLSSRNRYARLTDHRNDL